VKLGASSSNSTVAGLIHNDHERKKGVRSGHSTRAAGSGFKGSDTSFRKGLSFLSGGGSRLGMGRKTGLATREFLFSEKKTGLRRKQRKWGSTGKLKKTPLLKRKTFP